MNSKNVIGDPRHIWLVRGHQPFHFIDHRQGFSAPVRGAEDLVTAPLATIGASPRGDERERTLAMRVPPSLHVPANINGFARGPWLRIKIGDLNSLGSAVHQSIFRFEGDPTDAGQCGFRTYSER